MSEKSRKRSLRSALSAWTVVVISLAALFGSVALAARVTSISFSGQGDSSVIEIKSDGPIDAEKQENAQDKQIVLELKGASLARSAARPLDTSSFNSKVSLVSPYKVSGGSRVVVQLRDAASADMSQNGNVIRLKIANPPGGGNGSASTADSGGAASAAAAEGAPAAPATADSQPAQGSQASQASEASEDAKASDVSKESAAAPAAAEEAPKPKDRMDEFLEARDSHHFHGRPITLQARDAELIDVFRLIAEASGFNIIVGDDVRGKAPPLSLTDVPWDQALDVILRTKRLGAERSGNILRITTLNALTAEKQDELKAKIAAEATAPRITRVFPISFASLEDIQQVLTKFATVNQASIGAATATGGPAVAVQSGIVTTDKRTNSIIVNDTPENIERARKLIEVLDTQTPQVLIEAKVVEADEQGANSINGNIGGGNYTNGQPAPTGFSWAQSNNGSLALDPLFGSPGPNTSSSSFNGTSGGSVLGLGFGMIPGLNQLNATLNLLESQSHAQVISSPRSIVLNKEHASIVQTTPVGIPTTTISASGTTTTTTITQANLSLEVSPTVTNEGSVILKLTVHRDVPQSVSGGGQAVSSRSMDTTVLVESGSTLVLGGVYSATTQHTDSGFPILHNIPIIGWFFGQQSDQSDHEELIFFITPRILNAKEAGLS